MSPRPKKFRNCTCPHRPPGAQVFKPSGIPSSELEKVFLPLDELEALRLCDSQGLSQEDAGERLVKSGRRKIVEAIVNGSALLIAETGQCEQGGLTAAGED